MLRGADGAMTGFAYPEMMADVIAAFNAGDETRARDLFDAYLPLVRYESQPGLGLAPREATGAPAGRRLGQLVLDLAQHCAGFFFALTARYCAFLS